MIRYKKVQPNGANLWGPNRLITWASIYIIHMYTMPLSSFLHNAEVIKHHPYADDTMIHNTFNTSSLDNSIHFLQNSLVSVQDWISITSWSWSLDKTEFLLIRNKDFLHSFPIDILHWENLFSWSFLQWKFFSADPRPRFSSDTTHFSSDTTRFSPDKTRFSSDEHNLLSSFGM